MQVKADRYVVFIVRHEEVNYLLPLVAVVVLVHVSQFKAAVSVSVVSLYVHYALIAQLRGIDLPSVHYREVDGIAFLPSRGIE